MKKQSFCCALLLALLLMILPASDAAAADITVANPFTDVRAGAYYHDAVLWALDAGVTKGTTSSTFSPAATCTRGQVVSFLWRALGQPEPTAASTPFSDVKAGAYYYKAVLWAVENGVTKGTSATAFSPDSTCTSAEVVTFLWRSNAKPAAVGSSSLAAQYPDRYYTDALAWADGNGLLSGTGRAFAPDAQSPRSDIVTYLYRNAGSPSVQVSSTVAVGELTAEALYAQCAPAVFYLETYDAQGAPLFCGSGFFINSNGTAVTNYHVIEGAQSAKIMVSDTGKLYDVTGVYAYDAAQDWAILKINGSGFASLKIGDSSAVVGGATAYAIGSPLGLTNSITQGLISNPKRTLDGVDYIQTSAAISPGSSGGALVNKYGEVIGVTAATYVDGQNLNLAVPMSIIPTANIGSSYKTLSAVSPGGQALSGPEAALAKLKNYLLANGEYTQSDDGKDNYYWKYVFDTSGNVRWAIAYNINDGSVFFDATEWVDGSEYDYATLQLYLNDEFANPGECLALLVVESSSYGEHYVWGYEYFYTSQLTRSSGFSFDEVEIYSSISQQVYEQLCAEMRVQLLDEVKSLLQPAGVTLRDLGFTNF